MRILVVITKGDLGGAQTHVIELCRALKERFEFSVLIGGVGASPLESCLQKIGVRTVRARNLSNSLSPFNVIKSTRQLTSEIKIWKPDAIHAHSAVAGVVARLGGALSKVPVIYTVHGFGFKPEVPLFRRSVIFFVEQLLAPLTARMICVSQFELYLSEKLLIARKRITVISNGISDSFFRCNPGIETVSLIMVARMDSPKRHDLLLKALVVLRNRGVSLPKVIFAGGGSSLLQLQVTCDLHKLDTVKMLGDLVDIPEQLAGNQVFILLSDHEGQPISIIEAMRAGMPIIASDLPGIRSQISHLSEGLLTENKAECIADAIQTLLINPSIRTTMGRAARQRYEQEFSAHDMANRVANVYQNLMAPVSSL